MNRMHTVIAKLRGQDEVGLGPILGSNIFNGLLIVGVTAIIYPIHVGWPEVAGALTVGILAVALGYPQPVRLDLPQALPVTVYLVPILRR